MGHAAWVECFSNTQTREWDLKGEIYFHRLGKQKRAEKGLKVCTGVCETRFKTFHESQRATYYIILFR